MASDGLGDPVRFLRALKAALTGKVMLTTLTAGVISAVASVLCTTV